MTLPLPPIKNAKYATARELMGIGVRTGENGAEPPAGNAPGVPPVVPLPFQTGGDVDVFPAQIAGELDPGWPVQRFDSRGQNQVRVVTTVETAGAAGSKVFAQASSDGTTFAAPGTAAVEASLGTVGPKPAADAGWVDLAPAAIGDLLWRMRLVGGNASASPALWGSMLQFRQKTAPRPPRGTPGDLPEGGVWGNIVLDLNVTGALFQALGLADGDDVNLWPDERGLHDFATAAALLLPKYRASSFGGSRPCVEWAGANVALTNAANPTAPYGEYTYYFMVEGLDGGDGAWLWASGIGDSFQYRYDVYSSQIQIANNNLFGSPSITASDDWGMSGRHVYRFVKNPGSSSHQLFVGGALKGSAGAAPQTNNDGLTYLMSYVTGLGLAGKVGRVVAYDKKHDSPTNVGAVAPGMTAPEAALAGYWL